MAYPMIDELAGAYISVQGRLARADDPEAGVYFQPTGQQMFYEVIRVVRGIPLFWEGHLERLVKSVQGTITVPDSLYDECRQLIAANGIAEANLRLVLTAGSRICHLTPSCYPSRGMFDQGVPTGILNWEREEPNIKLIRADYKAAVANRFSQPGPYGSFYELLLADRSGRLTEGSRSNLFFIRGRQVLSAPESRILKGITRQYVLEAIVSAGASLIEATLTLEDIRQGRCEAAFLSGSPIDLLPISSIEDVRLESARNPLLRRIDQAYSQIVGEYVAARQAVP